MTLTAEQRAKLRRLEKEATPGPWQKRCCNDHHRAGEYSSVCHTLRDAAGSPVGGDVHMALLAAARNALPALLDAADRADAMVPLLVEALAYLAEHTSTEPRREGVAKLCDRIAKALK